MAADYYGIVELGSTLPVTVQIGADQTPAAPDAAPTYSIYEAGGTEPNANYDGASMSQVDSKTGLYRGLPTVSSANGFDRGNYFVLIEWEESSSGRAQKGSFTVV